MIAAIRKLFTRRLVTPLEAEIGRLEAEYALACKRHRPRAHIAERLQRTRHALMRAQQGK